MTMKPFGAETALFLDFDGTLAPLQDDPGSVHVSSAHEALLVTGAAALGGAVAIVTGRDGRDIAKRVPLALWRASNHGLCIAPPDNPPPALPDAPASMREGLLDLATAHGGLLVEEKGAVLALHWRSVPDLVDKLSDEMAKIMRGHEGYRLERGNGILEFKPEAAHKGRAIEQLMAQAPFSGRRAVFIGDDTTDEDGFAVVNQLDGLSIRVGPGDTVATARLATPADVWRYLEESIRGLT